VKRVLVLVEGQTEETFINEVLARHFVPCGLSLTAIVQETRRTKKGKKFKGGITSYAKVRRNLVRLLGDRGAAAVTTMLDYYGLPADFPGMQSLPSAPGDQKASHLEAALHEDLGDHRLLPYFSLHEFEALLLVDPGKISTAVATEVSDLVDLVTMRSPEEINDGEETHPAARIKAVAKGYRKVLHGPVIAERIGLAALRQRCPHFDGWVGQLESLAQ
jgi:hypothetical protein